jgi:hypothetical protein
MMVRVMRPALRVTLCALSVLAFLQGGGTARGQDQPLQLYLGNTDQPSTLGDDGGAGDSTPAQAIEQDTLPARQGIEVDALTGPDPAATGTLGAGQGGFPADVWQGSRRASVAALLTRANGGLTSPVLRAVLVRLLLTAASAPARASNAHDDPPGAFLAGRVEALMALGAPEGVLELLARVPRNEQGEAVMRSQAEALLTAGAYDEACRLIDREIVAYHAEVFWGRGLVFCQIRRDEIDQAMLGLDLLRESGSHDPLFSALAFHYAGGDMQDAPAVEVSALHIAMIRLMNLPVSDEILAAAPAYLWAALLDMKGLSAAQRAELGERAAAAGVLTPDALASVYRELAVPDEKRTAALSTDPGSSDALDRASLFQAASTQSLDIAQAEALQRLLQSANFAGRYGVVRAAALSLMERLQPRADLSWFAGSAARAFFIDGQLERARAWLRLAELDAAGGSSAPELRRSLLPYLLFHGVAGDDSGDGVALLGADELASLKSGGEESAEALSRATALYAALLAVGADIRKGWSDLVAQEAMPPGNAVEGPVILAIRDTAGAGRVGEALLLVAALIGERSLVALNAVEVDAILRALRAVGLTEEARLLAIDVALANGY